MTQNEQRNEFAGGPIPPDVKQMFERTLHWLREGSIALLSTTEKDGAQRWVLTMVSEDPEDPEQVRMFPLAYLLTDEMMDNLNPPSPDVEVVDNREKEASL